MNIAIVGCGYVADMYAATLRSYARLHLAGVYDTVAERARSFASPRSCRVYASLDELLGDDDVELVLNLTNPRNHFEVSHSCLEHGKHVYSEKPLGMTVGEANELLQLSNRVGRSLAAAPCSVLSETAQTVWKAIRTGAIGRVRLIYANFDDGMIAPREAPWTERNERGVPWPAQDEFETGCTYEHAGYVLTWLGAFFGPARRVTAFASTQIADKGIPVQNMAPDFSVGCLEYDDGIVARVTCGLVAPRDKSLTVIGDEGVLFVGNVRNDAGPVMLRGGRFGPIASRIAGLTRWAHPWLEGRIQWPGADALFQRRIPLVRQPAAPFVSAWKRVDFCRGVDELASSISERRPCRLSGEFAVHIVDLIERLQFPERNADRRVGSTFSPVEPMPWAR